MNRSLASREAASVLAFSFLVLSLAPGRSDQVPPTEAASAVRLSIAQPGVEYRGHRFDWSGLITHMDFGGITIFGPWSGRNDPADHDANAVGPIMEFGITSALGYDDADRLGMVLAAAAGYEPARMLAYFNDTTDAGGVFSGTHRTRATRVAALERMRGVATEVYRRSQP